MICLRTSGLIRLWVAMITIKEFLNKKPSIFTKRHYGVIEDLCSVMGWDKETTPLSAFEGLSHKFMKIPKCGSGCLSDIDWELNTEGVTVYREKRFFYITECEYSMLNDYLEEIRKEHVTFGARNSNEII